MEGMLQALESRVNLAQGQVLSPRLQSLLHKQQRSANLTKLSARPLPGFCPKWKPLTEHCPRERPATVKVGRAFFLLCAASG
jgi:hypothetical protein